MEPTEECQRVDKVAKFKIKGFDLESVTNDAINRSGAHGEVSRCLYCGVLFVNSPPKLSESCNSASCFLKDLNENDSEFFTQETRKEIEKL